MRIALVLCFALLLAASPAAWAGGTRTESATYYPTPELILTDSPVNLGVVFFPSFAADTSVTIVAEDESGLPVNLRACQDTEGDNDCGDIGEPTVVGCGSLTMDASAGFTAELEVMVTYSNVAGVILDTCSGSAALATMGTMTATFTTR